ncbi:TraB/GumN family protein [Altererythrobacter aerius]|uniref:TraB/GumN family protein n=1 Tax=Tsuneonella aeria TaxID=1837929 RepID=A0A6I4TCH0_9SPHN|nr:TraB/GumN family protein [Tsuneonella aeria]MXO73840.1 TraB/GumN family protein [Tsuneonella aeria]
MLKTRLLRTLASALGLLFLPGCAATQDAARLAAAAPVAAPAGPALWKVADEDTTIYLFGTVHVLPKDTQWYDARIARALESSGSIVTELPPAALSDPKMQQVMMSYAMLPADKNLRALLTPEQKATYEAALTKLKVPVEAFDRFDPWFAGMTLSMLPLIQTGWNPESGVEKVLEGKAGTNVERGAVETVEMQMKLFDELPQDAQVAFLMAAAENLDKVVPQLQAMVDAWSVGDADKLAALMNEQLQDDPALADRLLYARNRNWAEWIDQRLDQPGTVFMAVGAGHLAGAESVQAALGKRGIQSVRVQ